MFPCVSCVHRLLPYLSSLCLFFLFPFKVNEKVVPFVLGIAYFDQMKSGGKCCEMRRRCPYWQTRLDGATHVLFGRAYSGIYLPKKKIDRIDIVPTANAVQYGGPPPGTNEHEALFKADLEMFVIHFAPFTEQEIQKVGIGWAYSGGCDVFKCTGTKAR